VQERQRQPAALVAGLVEHDVAGPRPRTFAVPHARIRSC
jgi:hypothetical protein